MTSPSTSFDRSSSIPGWTVSDQDDDHYPVRLRRCRTARRSTPASGMRHWSIPLNLPVIRAFGNTVRQRPYDCRTRLFFEVLVPVPHDETPITLLKHRLRCSERAQSDNSVCFLVGFVKLT